MKHKTKRTIARVILTALALLVVALVAVAITMPVQAEPVVIVDELARPVGPAECWEAPSYEMEMK